MCVCFWAKKWARNEWRTIFNRCVLSKHWYSVWGFNLIFDITKCTKNQTRCWISIKFVSIMCVFLLCISHSFTFTSNRVNGACEKEQERKRRQRVDEKTRATREKCFPFHPVCLLIHSVARCEHAFCADLNRENRDTYLNWLYVWLFNGYERVKPERFFVHSEKKERKKWMQTKERASGRHWMRHYPFLDGMCIWMGWQSMKEPSIYLAKLYGDNNSQHQNVHSSSHRMIFSYTPSSYAICLVLLAL